MKPIRLMTLAPGHFHAALVQKRMIVGVAAKSHVYGPLDADTAAHLDRLVAFNNRPDDPTAWEVDLRAGANWLDRFLREQPGNTVVLSGRNRPKIDLMRTAVGHGLHVLADKPWVVEAADFSKLEELFRDAESRDVLVWDVMTERHEVTNRLQRELVNEPDIFGTWQVGTPDRPALVLESVHHLRKSVAGRQLVRPWWWFDSSIAGEAMADVGTHLADLALWFVAPDRAVNSATDIKILSAEGWPLPLSGEQFRELTGLASYPPEFAVCVVNGQLSYAGNGTVTFTLGGVHVKLGTQWEYEAPPGGGDTHTCVAMGTRSRVMVRQQPGGEPDVFVAAHDPAEHAALARRLFAMCDDLREQYPGLSMSDRGSEVQFRIPAELRTGHEAHFAAVMEEFARYFHTPRPVPPWERPNLLAKYYITTRAVELARENRPK
jgi:predicted dehydrogenase